MCILAIANAGAEFPRETLEDMFYANSDGAGWAYARNGLIYYSKGYTDVNKFVKAVQKLPLNVDRMVHCRIGTHGGITKALTHPFPVSTDYEVMERLSGTMSRGYILAHNGILSNFTPDKSHSDTEELVRCLANIKCDIMGEDMRDIINALIKGSRVAILNTDGKINRYGTGWTQDGGIWFSNTYFKNTYKRYYSAWDDDEWDGYYNNYKTYTSPSPSTSVKDSLPALESLTPIQEGEVVRIKRTKSAYINTTYGAYLVDEKTDKLYGQYKGAIYTTDYEICNYYGCQTCDYKCPFREESSAGCL